MKSNRFPNEFSSIVRSIIVHSSIVQSTALVMLALAILATLTSSVFAQSAKGTLTGRAADSQNAVLPGARVRVEPGGVAVATDQQGEFTVINLTPGDYKVTVSYVGFLAYTVDVKVVAGQATRVDAVLKVEAKGEEVTVVADAQGVAQAINQQRTSDNILDVMPEGVINSLPNENIADVVGRMPGVSLERDEGEGKYVQIRGTEPRLNNTTVDGVELPAPEDNVRQFKLDTIPSGIVEAVEVNKTLAANQDADAIGGTVNLVTKKAGDLPTLEIEGIGGFTPIVNTRYIGLVIGTVGQRFGHDKRFGALFSGSYDYNGRGIDDIEPQPDPNFAIPVLRQHGHARVPVPTKALWLWRIARLQTGTGSGLYFTTSIPISKTTATNGFTTLNDDVTQNPAGPSAPPIIAGDVPKFSTSQRVPDYSAGSIAIGGKHVFTSSWLSWELSAAESREGGAAGNPGATFKPVSGSALRISALVSSCRAPISTCRSWTHPAPGSPTYDPTQYSITEYDGTSGDNLASKSAGRFVIRQELPRGFALLHL